MPPKRPPPSKGSGSGSTNKRQKVANKKSSSKTGGRPVKTGAQVAKDALGKKQKEYTTPFGASALASGNGNKGKGRGGKAAPAADEGSDGINKVKKIKDRKGKATIREYIDVPGVANQDDDENEEDDDDEEVVDVQDMLIDPTHSDSEDNSENNGEGSSSDRDSIEGDEIGRAAFLASLDTRGMSKCVCPFSFHPFILLFLLTLVSPNHLPLSNLFATISFVVNHLHPLTPLKTISSHSHSAPLHSK